MPGYNWPPHTPRLLALRDLEPEQAQHVLTSIGAWLAARAALESLFTTGTQSRDKPCINAEVLVEEVLWAMGASRKYYPTTNHDDPRMGSCRRQLYRGDFVVLGHAFDQIVDCEDDPAHPGRQRWVITRFGASSDNAHALQWHLEVLERRRRMRVRDRPPMAPIFRVATKLDTPTVIPVATVGVTSKLADCSLKIKPFVERDCRMDRETAAYYKLDLDKQHVLGIDGEPEIASGPGQGVFDLAYDDANKVLTATVRVLVLPKAVHVVDLQTGKFKLDDQGQPITVPYENSRHGSSASGQDRLLYRMQDRAVKPDTFTLKAEIESVLNQHGYKLAPDPCERGGGCGCLVRVNFAIEFIARGEKASGKAHVSINLFQWTERADAVNWGEMTVVVDKYGTRVEKKDSVAAHEAGHLFSWPDEYWLNGGSCHKQYIKQMELDFARGEELKGQATWQMQSLNNLMGFGASKSNAVVPEYYLYRIRDWFERKTGRAWKIMT